MIAKKNFAAVLVALVSMFVASQASAVQRLLPLYQIGDGDVMDNDGRIVATPSQDGYGYVYSPGSGLGNAGNTTCDISASEPAGVKIAEWWRYETDPRFWRPDTAGEKLTSTEGRLYTEALTYQGGLLASNIYQNVEAYLRFLVKLGVNISIDGIVSKDGNHFYSGVEDIIWYYTKSADRGYFSTYKDVKADIEKRAGTKLDFVLDAITGFTWKYSDDVASLQYIVVKYKYINYKLTYRLGVDSGVASEVMNHDYTNVVTIAKPGELNFSKIGWTFNSWTNASGKVFAPGEKVTGADLGVTREGDTVTLYAQWDANHYSVEFDSNGGEGDMDDEPFVYGDSQQLTGAGFERLGYSFAGWSDTNTVTKAKYVDEATVLNLLSTVNGTQKLYAVWNANTYTIEYDGNGASNRTMSATTATYDQNVKLKDCVFALEGATFVGWALSPKGDAIYGDGEVVMNLTAQAGGKVVLYAVWSASKYTISYEANGGKGEMERQALEYGEVAELSKCAFKRDGYYFAGWSGDGGVVYADRATVSNLTATAGGEVVLTARWAPNEWTVTYSAEGSSDAPEAQTFTAGQAAVISKEVPTRVNYEFVVWRDADGNKYAPGTDVRVLFAGRINATIALAAVWQERQYTVCYDSNGGVGEMGSSVFGRAASAKLPKCAFSRLGYSFVGWILPDGSTNSVGTAVASSSLVGDSMDGVTLKAAWKSNAYVVNYNGNGAEATGTGKVTQDFVYGESQTLDQNSFVRDGYTFVGWSTERNGAAVYGDGALAGNLTVTRNDTALYAVWRANEYTVTYVANGAEAEGEMAREIYAYGTSWTMPECRFVWPGHAFLGWALAGEKNVRWKSGARVSNLAKTDGASVTLAAIWGPAAYAVRYEGNGATSGKMSDQSFLYDEEQELAANVFKRAGYAFVGWAESEHGGKKFDDLQAVKNLTVQNGSTVSLWAVWKPNAYAVRFEGNGATSGTMEDETFNYDETKALTANGFVNNGCTFVGWSTNATGAVVYGDREQVRNLVTRGTRTLYAVWKPLNNISFNAGGGNGEMQNVETDEGYKAPECGFTRTGWTFIGWGTNNVDGVVYNPGDTIVGSVELTALWTENKYTVLYNPNGGLGNYDKDIRFDKEGRTVSAKKVKWESETHNYSEKFMLNPLRYTRTGYNFKGWTTNCADVVDFAPDATVSKLTTDANGKVVLTAVWEKTQDVGELSKAMHCEDVVWGASTITAPGGYWGVADKGYGSNNSSLMFVVMDASLRMPSITNRLTTSFGTLIFKVRAECQNGKEPRIVVANGGRDLYDKVVEDVWQPVTVEGIESSKRTEIFVTGVKDNDTRIYIDDMSCFADDWMTVEFDANDGIGNMSAQTYQNKVQDVLLLNEFTREGYDFVGWEAVDYNGTVVCYRDGETICIAKGNGNYKGKEALTLKACWEEKEREISFAGNGGDGAVTPIAVKYHGSTILPANGFARVGYHFIGWGKSADAMVPSWQPGDDVNYSEAGSSPVIYALWAQDVMTIEFDVSPASGTMSPKGVLWGADFIVPECTVGYEGYECVGWATNGVTDVDYGIGATIVSVKSDIELAAVWRPVDYSIVFAANGGSGSMSRFDLAYGEDAALPTNAYVRSGWTFGGWSAEDGSTLEDGATVKNMTSQNGGVVTLTAIWIKNAYTIAYHNGSEVTNIAARAFNRTTTISKLEGRTGWTFEGWATSKSALQAAYGAGEIVSNLTLQAGGEVDLWAVWTANKYTIEFASGGASGTMAPVDAQYDAPLTLPANIFVNGTKNFVGWTTNDAASAMIYADGAIVTNLTSEAGAVVTLTALWSEEEWGAVSYHPNGGSGAMTVDLFTYGEAPKAPECEFERFGWAFAGWALKGDGAAVLQPGDDMNVVLSAPNAQATLYAVWDECDYKIRFDASISDATGTMKDVAGVYGKPVALPKNSFTAEGAAFVGWTLDTGDAVSFADGEEVVNLSGEDGAIVTLYAVWERNSVNVSFDANGGSGRIDDSVYTIGAAKALPASGFTRAGYALVGWARYASATSANYALGEAVDDFYSASGALTLYAVWKPDAIEVSFDCGPGVLDPDGYWLAYGDVIALPGEEFVKPGWSFTGWSLDSDSEIPDYGAGAIVSNITADTTFYAVWQANTYTIKFEANGGVGKMTAQECRYSQAEELPPNVFARAGHSFVGWALSANGDALYADGEVVENLTAKDGGTVTLYASWFEGELEPDEPVKPDTPDTPDKPDTSETYELFPSGTEITGEFTSTAAATYVGWLRDSSGRMAGALTVKTSAVRAAGRASKSTIIYTPISGKKRTIRTTVMPGGNPMDEYGIVYGNLGLVGKFEGMTVEASKDFTKAKAATEKALVNEMPQGAWTCAFLNSAGAYNLFSVSVGKKGKAKVAGTLADGTRATFTVQGVLGEDGVFAVPVAYPRKGIGFVLWIGEKGEVTVSDLAVSGWTFKAVGVRTNLAAGTHTLSFDIPTWHDYLTEVDGFAATPNDSYIITVASGNGKWTVARKVGSIASASGVPYVKYNAARQTPTNLSALRMTYTASTGVVRGSFKLSYMNGARVKMDAVTVTGMVIDSRFIGTGSVRRLGTFPITSEKQ